MNLTIRNRTGWVVPSETDRWKKLVYNYKIFHTFFFIHYYSSLFSEKRNFLMKYLLVIESNFGQIDFFLDLLFFTFYWKFFRRLMAPNLFTIIFWQMTDTRIVSFVCYYSTDSVVEMQWRSCHRCATLSIEGKWIDNIYPNKLVLATSIKQFVSDQVYTCLCWRRCCYSYSSLISHTYAEI